MLFRLVILALMIVCAQNANAVTQAEKLRTCAQCVLVTLVQKDDPCIVPQVHLNFCKSIDKLNFPKGSLQTGFANIVKESLKDPEINGWFVSLEGKRIWGEETDESKLDVCLVFTGPRCLPTFKMPDVRVMLLNFSNGWMPFLGTCPMFPNLKKFVVNSSGLFLPLMRPNVRTVWNLSQKSDILFLFQAPNSNVPPHPTLFSCADPYVCTSAAPGEARIYVSRDGQRPGGRSETTLCLKALCGPEVIQTGSSKIAHSSGLWSSQGVEVESDETSSQFVEGESNPKLEPKELTVLDLPNELVNIIASYLRIEDGFSLVRAIPIFAGSFRCCRGGWVIEKPLSNTSPYTRSELIQMMAKELMNEQKDGMVTSTFKLYGWVSAKFIQIYQTIKVDWLDRCVQSSGDGPVFVDRAPIEKASQEGDGLSSSAMSGSKQSSSDVQSVVRIPDALRLSLEWRLKDDQEVKPFFVLSHVILEPAGALAKGTTGERFSENVMTLLGFNEWCQRMSPRGYDGRSREKKQPVKGDASDSIAGPAA